MLASLRVALRLFSSFRCAGFYTQLEGVGHGRGKKRCFGKNARLAGESNLIPNLE